MIARPDQALRVWIAISRIDPVAVQKAPLKARYAGPGLTSNSARVGYHQAAVHVLRAFQPVSDNTTHVDRVTRGTPGLMEASGTR